MIHCPTWWPNLEIIWKVLGEKGCCCGSLLRCHISKCRPVNAFDKSFLDSEKELQREKIQRFNENLLDDRLLGSLKLDVHEWEGEKKDFLLTSLDSVSSWPMLRCQQGCWTFGGSDTFQMTVI